MTTVGLVRAVLTAILFVAFIALWIWAWSKHRKTEFDAAALLPLQDDESRAPLADQPPTHR
ncbi:MAG TPA: cbb3-type cytochrome c oxidase subunit 3 [Steroidobacter sp.]|jgi:cytochrome c oxidase cbb3-type subunit 4|nr:cbb3-type cytochrome c oxidase subunit 3 [Steroidobacter sp.]